MGNATGEFDSATINSFLDQGVKSLLKGGGEDLNGLIAKIRREKEKKYLCPQQHLLKRFITDQDSFTCDVCQKRQSRGSELYGCRVCNWDCCSICIKKLKPRKQVKVKLQTEVVYSIYSTWDGVDDKDPAVLTAINNALNAIEAATIALYSFDKTASDTVDKSRKKSISKKLDLKKNASSKKGGKQTEIHKKSNDLVKKDDKIIEKVDRANKQSNK